MSSPDSCPVVRVSTPVTKGNKSGFVEINESDFDEAKHVLWDGRPSRPETDEEIFAREQAELKRLADEAEANAPRDANGLRTDGPTAEEWVKAGYAIEGYPPSGYAVKEAPVSAGWGTAPPPPA